MPTPMHTRTTRPGVFPLLLAMAAASLSVATSVWAVEARVESSGFGQVEINAGLDLRF